MIINAHSIRKPLREQETNGKYVETRTGFGYMGQSSRFINAKREKWQETRIFSFWVL